jgi:hypothetical protein
VFGVADIVPVDVDGRDQYADAVILDAKVE